MQTYNIFITEPDMEQLSHMVDSARESASTDPEQLNMLEGELDRAQIVSPFGIPADVVTMHSRVRVRDLNANKDSTYTLVFPRDADFAQGKISVLAPVGTAILGCRTGQCESSGRSREGTESCASRKSCINRRELGEPRRRWRAE